MKTLFVKPAEAPRAWYVIDAQGKRLGRVAVKVAQLLRGKNKPFFTGHQEIGDYVIVINASKNEVSGRKRRWWTAADSAGFAAAGERLARRCGRVDQSARRRPRDRADPCQPRRA